jgi:penicillin-binding protein 2
MIMFGQSGKHETPLRWLAAAMFLGMIVLVSQLWHLQIISSKRFVATEISQSFRSVRVPAVRGKIMDRNGFVLAENRASYNIGLYLDELSPLFREEFSRTLAAHGRSTRAQRNAMQLESRYRVASNIVHQLGILLNEPLVLNEHQFHRHWETRRFLPLPVVQNLSPAQIARFEEQPFTPTGLDLQQQSLRVYPHGTAASHILGYLTSDDRADDDEDVLYNYRLPDFRGALGIEGNFDRDLRGRADMKSVLVNNLGYRQSEITWTTEQPGRNVYLTIDLPVQMATEAALRSAGPQIMGAAVVMDAQNGDLIAMASSPTFDPNVFVPRILKADWDKLNDPDVIPMLKRPTHGFYQPGSVFKLLIALAALELGVLDPNEEIYHPGFRAVGRSRFNDESPAGFYNLDRAVQKSSNSYFIDQALKPGVLQKTIELGEKLHFGETTDLAPRQESRGIFPNRRQIGRGWFDGDTANLSMGQAKVALTPIQAAVMMAALANGGKVFWPRIVERIVPQEGIDETPIHFPAGRLRNELGVKPQHYDTLHRAMLTVLERGGTAANASVPGMAICGKTGTAQVDRPGRPRTHTAWFASFAPYGSPRYVVVVVVEDGSPGGGRVCGPIARQIYQAIQKRENIGRTETMAKAD